VKGRGPEHWTRGNAGALRKQGGGFRCRGGRWQRIGACLTFCLGLKHVHKGTRSVGYLHGFLIKHPAAGSVSTAEHHDDDHKRGGVDASVTTIFLSTWRFHAVTRIESGWLHSGGDIPDDDLFCLDATALELLHIIIDSVCTIVVRRFFPSTSSIHASLRIVEDMFNSP
jgi:hypothetical protein